jgi:periplasmic divalent cation tolerance protein
MTTCPDGACAEALARRLVEGRLAACVNILPRAWSVYAWNGAIERTEEHLLLIKTCSDRYDEVERVLRAHHPYELPEVIAVPVQNGSAPYLAWLDACVSPDA